ncbi:MAG: Ig-like domain-containing protein [Candidatus Nanoarchaeia archaeon]|nr:Ig-like domain-containing protein [Candidatus Nanoarchaeia archaeon]
MRKRYLLLIIAALLLMPMAFAAITVTLTTPDDAYTSSSSTVAFTCSASDDTPGNTISSVHLYLDTTGTWAENKSVSGGSSSSLDLTAVDVEGIPNGVSYTWACKAVNNLLEEQFAAANRTFTVSVAENIAPQLAGTVPNQTFNEDATLSNAFDLDTYFTDSTALTYTAAGNTQITVSIATDGQVTFSSTNNWSGSELIQFTASDGSLTNTSNYINVSVTPVNDAPYYTTIPTQNMTKNTNKTITLSSYFGDVEGTSLTYNVSSAPSHMNYTISGATVTLAPEPNWTGTTSITFSASDGNATTNSNSVSLVVSAGNASNTTNRPPSLGCPTGWTSIMAGESKTFIITKSDPDGDTLTVTWKIGTEAISGETGDSYTFSKSEAGSYALKAIVSDGTEEKQCSWDITVAAVENYTSASGADIDSIIAEQTEEVVRCGDGKIQEGEDCASCPSDVSCKVGEICSQGVCVPKKSSSSVLLVIGIIIAVILGGGFTAYKLTTRRKEETRVREVRTLSQVEKELPSMDLHDIYEKESPKPDTDSIPAPVENPLTNYVNTMRGKGVSDADIRKALKEKGWNDALIKAALKH